MTRSVVSLFVLLAAFPAASQVASPSASAATSRQGRLRLSAATDLLGLTAFGDGTHLSLGPGAFVRTVGADDGADLDALAVSGTRGLRLEAAYLLVDGLALGLQGRAGFAFLDVGGSRPPRPGDLENDPGSRTRPSFALVPFVEVLLGGGSIVPYVGGGLGVGFVFEEDLIDGSRETVEVGTRFIAGASGGLHLFAADDFSVGLELQVELIYDGGAAATGLDVALLFELAGWA